MGLGEQFFPRFILALDIANDRQPAIWQSVERVAGQRRLGVFACVFKLVHSPLEAIAICKPMLPKADAAKATTQGGKAKTFSHPQSGEQRKTAFGFHTPGPAILSIPIIVLMPPAFDGFFPSTYTGGKQAHKLP